MRTRINKCVICGAEFQTTSASSKYCSRECRMRARKPNWTAQSRWGHSYDHICKWCGKPYVSGSPNGDYCTPSCKVKAYKAVHPKENKPKQKSLAEIVAEADAMGMSYGQYVAHHMKSR